MVPNPRSHLTIFNITMQCFRFASLLFFLDPVILIYVIQVHVLYSNPLQRQKEPNTLEQTSIQIRNDAFLHISILYMYHYDTQEDNFLAVFPLLPGFKYINLYICTLCMQMLQQSTQVNRIFKMIIYSPSYMLIYLSTSFPCWHHFFFKGDKRNAYTGGILL